MRLTGDFFTDAVPAEKLPELQLRAFCVEDQRQMLRMLSLVLVPSGGWLLRHRRTSLGILDVVFEFERSSAMDIYVMLVALGLELTSSSHVLLTSFCQRTADLPPTESIQVACCSLEIRELSDEAISPEQLFGASAMA